MTRRLLNLLTALSLLLCLAVAALRVRSRYFANDWLGFTIGGRLFECWTSPDEGVVVRTVGDWPVHLPAARRSVEPHEKFVGYVLTKPGGGPPLAARTLDGLGSVEGGTASVQYEPDGVRPAWDALRDWPFDRSILSGQTRTYDDGNIPLSPPLPVVGVRVRFWLLGALATVLQGIVLVVAVGLVVLARRSAARGWLV